MNQSKNTHWVYISTISPRLHLRSEPSHLLPSPVFNYGASDWLKLSGRSDQSGILLRWPLTPSGGPCVCFCVRALMSACCVCVGFKTVFRNPPSGQSVWRGRRDRVHQEPPTHPQTLTSVWAQVDCEASFESTSGSTHSHAEKITTGKRLGDDSLVLSRDSSSGRSQVLPLNNTWFCFYGGKAAASAELGALWQRRSASKCAAAAYKSCQAADICTAPRF